MSRCVSLYHALAKALANSFGFSWNRFEIWRINRIHLQCEVGREHHRGVRLLRIVSIRHGPLGSRILGSPLPRAGRTLHQFPFVAKQVIEVAV